MINDLDELYYADGLEDQLRMAALVHADDERLRAFVGKTGAVGYYDTADGEHVVVFTIVLGKAEYAWTSIHYVMLIPSGCHLIALDERGACYAWLFPSDDEVAAFIEDVRANETAN